MSYSQSKAARTLRLLAVLVLISFAFITHGLGHAQLTFAALPAPTGQREDAGALIFQVTVTNKRGDYVGGLKKSNFVVLDGKAPQEITYFRGQGEPVSVGIILDVSRSMFDTSTHDLMKALFNEAILRFIQQGNRSNEYFLIGFNERPQLMTDWTSDIEEINTELRQQYSIGFKPASYPLIVNGIASRSSSTWQRTPHRSYVISWCEAVKDTTRTRPGVDRT